MTLPTVVWDREKTEKGRVMGGTRPCAMESCRGLRIRVQWSDGRCTWPCSKGMRVLSDSEWQIR